jgi:hypothetical protein
LAKIIKEKGLVPAQIYNADETGLHWQAMPTRTLASLRETNAPGYKISFGGLQIKINCSGKVEISEKSEGQNNFTSKLF